MVNTPLMTHSQRGVIGAPALIGGIVVLILVLGGGYYLTQQLVSEERALGPQDTGNALPKGAVSKTNQAPRSSTAAQPAATFSGQVLAGTSAPLLVFNRADFDAALADGKLVVLYFYANWCPVCRAEFPAAQAAFNQLTSDQVVGFRVNFNDSDTDDSEEAMARRFGVPYQHTKVFVKGGQQLLKSPEEWDTPRYLDEVARHL